MPFLKHGQTPTLIPVGERESETPVAQSYELWPAFQTLGGKTPVVSSPPPEGHLIAQPEHRRTILKRLVAWFDAHLTPHEEDRAAHPARSWRRLTNQRR